MRVPRTAYLNLGLPTDLRERLRRLAKRMNISTKKLICDACSEKVAQMEKQFEQEDEERSSNRAKRMSSSLAPEPLSPSRPTAPIEAGDGNLRELYTEHAKKILHALSDTTEKRLRVAEAVAAIKKYAPLTHPGDSEILSRLENEIRTLQKSEALDLASAHGAAVGAPTKNAIDVLARRLSKIAEVVERTIDTSRVQTSGSLEDSEEDDNKEGNDDGAAVEPQPE